MKQHTITGLGPMQPTDTTMKIFTVLANPFIVSSEWLEEQGKAPAVGDIIEVNDKGELKLVTEEQAAKEEAEEEPEEGAIANDASPFKNYQSKPITFKAAQIKDVREAEGLVILTFEDGSDKTATPEVLSHVIPSTGDYWVIELNNEGVIEEYVIPQALFEAQTLLME